MDQDLVNSLRNCLRSITMAISRKISLERARELRIELENLQEQVCDYFEEDAPEKEIRKFKVYIQNIDEIIDKLESVASMESIVKRVSSVQMNDDGDRSLSEENDFIQGFERLKSTRENNNCAIIRVGINVFQKHANVVSI